MSRLGHNELTQKNINILCTTLDFRLIKLHIPVNEYRSDNKNPGGLNPRKAFYGPKSRNACNDLLQWHLRENYW